MGQIFGSIVSEGQICEFFQSIWQICRFSSNQQETEQINKETVGRDPELAQASYMTTADFGNMEAENLSQVSVSISDLCTTENDATKTESTDMKTPGDSTLTDPEADPHNTDIDGNLNVTDPEAEDLSQIVVTATDFFDRQNVSKLELTDPESEDLSQTVATAVIDLELKNNEAEDLPQIVTSTVDPIHRKTTDDLEQVNHEVVDETKVSLSTTNSGTTNTDIDLKLSDCTIEDLAREMEARKIESVAIANLGIGIETVNNLKVMRQNDLIAFNRDLLVLWRNKHPGINQVQRLADILYAAAEEGGYVDPHKVEQILKVPNPKKSTTSIAKDTITETEFLAIAEKLKPHVKKRMKIEPFPWLEGHLVNMKKLYTKLTLEIIEDTLSGENKKDIENYEEMFLLGSDSHWETEEEYSGDESSLNLETTCDTSTTDRNKILLKAHPGMGKTTLGKKIGFDWSNGEFNLYSIVFFLALNIVKPGVAIENVILQQHPELEGLKLSSEYIRAMLDRFGKECLLILDGLDECDFGQNEDVRKIIENRKLLDCGIVVSSRPHSINEVKRHFDSIINVEGFTKEEAEKFVSNFFGDKQKIAQILLFRPSDSREDFPFHQCPILLSFLCLLVKENKIDLSVTKVTIGELYLLMIECLYKKFMIRKGPLLENTDFMQVLKSVGQLALQTLISNNPLLKKSEVLAVVGKFAFEYGFFSGHRHFELVTSPATDICVTYVHRSVEEFFGSFGFIQDLDDGKSVDDILGTDCEKPIFMVNPLVLQFCLWLRTKEFFRRPQEIFDSLTFYVAELINVPTFLYTPFVERYPAMDVRSVLNKKSTKVEFFEGVFQRCNHIHTLHIENQEIDCVELVLALMRTSLLQKLTVLSIARNPLPPVVIGDDFTISIDLERSKSCHEVLKILLTNSDVLKRNPQVCGKIESNEPHDLSKLIQKHVKQLELVWRPYFPSESTRETLSVSAEFPCCPQFTHFTARRFQIDDSVPAAFMKAVKEGKFPNLRRIELSHCILNDCEWPEVPEFFFVNGTIRGTQKQNLLSNVTKLVNYQIDPLITTHLPKLSVLKVELREMKNLRCLNDMLRQGHLPNLSELLVAAVREEVRTQIMTFLDEFDPNNTVKLEKLALQRFHGLSRKELRNLSRTLSSFHLRELDMSESDFVTGSLSELFTHVLPRLSSLKLKSCDLNSEDVQSLAKAAVDSKVPKLKHLDISGYEQKFEISDLFVHSAQWRQLKTLVTNDFKVLSEEYEGLASIEKLYIDEQKQAQMTVTWPGVKVIELKDWDYLASIAEGVEQSLFPSLTTVKLTYTDMPIASSYPSLFKLYKANILVQGINSIPNTHYRRIERKSWRHN